MADNVFDQSISDQFARLSSPPPAEAPDLKTSLENIARQTRVPVNVLMSLSEAAGAKSPEDALNIASGAAQRLAPLMAQGKSAKDALTEILGKDHAAAVDPIMQRAWAIAGEMYPGRVKAPQEQQQKAQAPEEASFGRKVADAAVNIGAGALGGGIGLGLVGLGDLVAKASDALIVNPVNAVANYARGLPAGTHSVLGPTNNLLKPAGEQIMNWANDAANALISKDSAKAMAESGFEGDWTKPWTIRIKPGSSLNGLIQQSARVFGTQAPMLFMPEGKLGLLAAGIFGASGAAGDQAEAAEQRIDDLSKQVDANGVPLVAQLPIYQQALKEGLNPDQALARTKQEAAKTAALWAAPIGALGEIFEQKVLHGVLSKAEAGNIFTRMISKAAASGAVEGVSEAGEVTAGRAGANLETGDNQNLTADTANDFVMGALGGATFGALGGIQRRQGVADRGGTAKPGMSRPATPATPPGAPQRLAGPDGSAPNFDRPPPEEPLGPMGAAMNEAPPAYMPGARPGDVFIVDPGYGADLFEATFVRESAAGPVVREADGTETTIPGEDIRSGKVTITPKGAAAGPAYGAAPGEGPGASPASGPTAPPPGLMPGAAPITTTGGPAPSATPRPQQAAPQPKPADEPTIPTFTPFGAVTGKPFTTQRQAAIAAKKKLGHSQFQIINNPNGEGFLVAPLPQAQSPNAHSAPVSGPASPVTPNPQPKPQRKPAEAKPASDQASSAEGATPPKGQNVPPKPEKPFGLDDFNDLMNEAGGGPAPTTATTGGPNGAAQGNGGSGRPDSAQKSPEHALQGGGNKPQGSQTGGTVDGGKGSENDQAGTSPVPGAGEAIPDAEGSPVNDGELTDRFGRPTSPFAPEEWNNATDDERKAFIARENEVRAKLSEIYKDREFKRLITSSQWGGGAHKMSPVYFSYVHGYLDAKEGRAPDKIALALSRQADGAIAPYLMGYYAVWSGKPMQDIRGADARAKLAEIAAGKPTPPENTDQTDQNPKITIEPIRERGGIVRGLDEAHKPTVEGVRFSWSKRDGGWLFSRTHMDKVIAALKPKDRAAEEKPSTADQEPGKQNQPQNQGPAGENPESKPAEQETGPKPADESAPENPPTTTTTGGPNPQAAPPTKPSGVPTAQDQAELMAKLAAYFKPGNVVKSYQGGYDLVIDFDSFRSGQWSVTVTGVIPKIMEDGIHWVSDPKRRHMHTHSVMPSEQDLEDGPIHSEPDDVNNTPSSALEVATKKEFADGLNNGTRSRAVRMPDGTIYYVTPIGGSSENVYWGVIVRKDGDILRVLGDAGQKLKRSDAVDLAVKDAFPENLSEQVGDNSPQHQGPAQAETPESAPNPIDQAAEQVDQNPTPAQAEAGNYQKGHVRWNGLDLTIETAKGSIRTGIAPDGTPWSATMPAHYGYIKRTEDADGEQVDFYMGDNPDSDVVLMIDQVDPDTKLFDEHKIILGAKTGREARALYVSYFSDGSGAKRIGAAKLITVSELKDWLANGDTSKPYSPSVKTSATKPTRGPKQEDFGEKIGGMRKDRAKKFVLDLGSEINTQHMTLAEAFPIPDYEALAANGATPEQLAAVAMIRSKIERKPTQIWKLTYWIDTVDTGRQFAAEILEGKRNPAEWRRRNISDADMLTFRALSKVDPQNLQWVVSNLKLHAGRIYDKQAKVPDWKLMVWLDTIDHTSTFYLPKALGSWAAENPRGNTNDVTLADSDLAQAADLMNKAAEAERARKEALSADGGGAREAKIELQIRGPYKKPQAAIYSANPALVRITGYFPTLDAARSYLDANREKLEQFVREMRKGANERTGVNRLRHGPTWRKGDATENMFLKELGFRGVAFGESMTAAERRESMNQTYDAMMDLAGVLRLPPRAMSLDGALGLGFGTHGKGGPGHWAAVYLQSADKSVDQVIALTRREGPGSLAHEWFHAVDNYLARKDEPGSGLSAAMSGKDAKEKNDFLSDRVARRRMGALPTHMISAFSTLNDALRKSEWAKRMRRLDSFRSRTYWSATIELAARGFERMVADALYRRDMVNDYLVNIDESGNAYPSPEEFWNSDLGSAYEGVVKAMQADLNPNGETAPKLPDVLPDRAHTGFKVGDEWESKDGTRRIIAYDEASGTYRVETLGQDGARSYDVEELVAKRISDAEAMSTAGQLAAEFDAAVRRAGEKAEDARKPIRELKARADDLAKEYLATLTSGISRAQEALDKRYRWPEPLGSATVAAMVVYEVEKNSAAAPRVPPGMNKRVFAGYEEPQLLKAGMDFAEWYHRKWEAQKAQAEALKTRLGFTTNSLDEDVLAEKVARAEQDMRDPSLANTAAGKGLTGETTGYFTKDFFLPTSLLASLPRVNDEQRKPGDPQYDRLMALVRKDGFLPDQNGNKILVEVNHLGLPYIVEGNTRVAVANDIEVPRLAVEVRYLNGGEAVTTGRLAPAVVLDRATTEPPDLVKVPESAPAPTTAPKGPSDPNPFNMDDFEDLLNEVSGGTPAPTTAPKPAPAVSPESAKITDAFVKAFEQGDRFRTITQARKLAAEAIGRELNEGDYLMVEEAIEAAVVKRARALVEANRSDPVAVYAEMMDLYQAQPILGERTPDKLTYQAFSTPAPLAYLASRLAGIGPSTRVVEPTAGNGMLLIEASPSNVQANEIQPSRLAALKDVLGPDAKITEGDALGVTFGPFDVLIANPPFGKVMDFSTGNRKEYPIGQTTTQEIDHAIAWHALQQMPDDGRAVLIVGGVKKQLTGDDRTKAYQTRAKLVFFKNLYDHYNVVDHFTVDGDLYSRQGAEWPVDVIVIDGRAPSVMTPPFAKAPDVLSTWADIGRKLNNAPDMDTTGRGPDRGESADTGQPGEGATDSGDIQGHAGGKNQPADRGGGQQRPAAPASGGRGGSGRGGRGGSGGGVAGDDGAVGRPGGQSSEPGNGGGVAGEAGATEPQSGGSGSGQSNGSSGISGGTVSPGGLSVNSDWSEIGSALLNALGSAYDPTKLYSGPAFVYDVWVKLKPIFTIAIRKAMQSLGVTTMPVKDMMRAVRDALITEAKMAVEQIRPLAPYFLHYAAQVQSGRLDPNSDDALKPDPPEQQASEFDVPYVPRSKSRFVVGTLVPINMQAAMNAALDKIEDEHGNIDEYVARELRYPVEKVTGSDAEEGYFSAEQVDALAMAIYNVARGKGFIIGDQTGIGKGRFVAAMLRYGMIKGRIPVFVTLNSGLYADMVRDLRDIGMSDIQDQIIATDAGLAPIPISGDNDLFTGAKRDELVNLFSALRNGKMPKGKKILFTTYSQMRTLGTIGKGEDARKKWPERAEALMAAAPNVMLVLDESHSAGGQDNTASWDVRKPGDPPTNTAEFMRDLVEKSAGSVFSSATYAKNPTVMSLYSSTDLSLTVDDMKDLGPAIKAGGIPLQQVIASQLTAAGQYIRRQKSMAGITPQPVEMLTNREHAIELSKAVSTLAKFDRDVMEPIRALFASEVKSNGLLVNGNSIEIAKANGEEFASVVHNLVNQFLLAVKLEAAANYAIEQFRKGEKVVISLQNTNGVILAEHLRAIGARLGDKVKLPFTAIVERYVHRLRRMKATDVNGNEHHIEIPDSFLGFSVVQQIDDLLRMVRKLPMDGLTGSPIDGLMDRMRAAGMKVDEISGRSTILRDGVVTNIDSSGADKKRRMNEFNAGGLDALILTASGSTGFSLHATNKKGNDGKRRHLIVLQPHADINIFVQTLGRVNRTGQTSLPAISIAFSDLAIEKRLAAMLMRKMASLSANTTAAKRNAMSIEGIDFINEVGDEVVAEYLASDPQLQLELGLPLEQKAKAPDGLANRFAARLVYLHPDQVERIYEEIEQAYIDRIRVLDEEGTNPLEAKTLDLRAKLLSTTALKEAHGTGSPLDQPLVSEHVSALTGAPPHTSEKVKELVDAAMGGKSEAEYRAEIEDKLRSLMPGHMAQLHVVADDRAEKLKAAQDEREILRRAAEASLAALQAAEANRKQAQSDPDISADKLLEAKQAEQTALREHKVAVRELSKAETATNNALASLVAIRERIAKENDGLESAIKSVWSAMPGKAFNVRSPSGEFEAVVVGLDLSKMGSNPLALSRIKVRIAQSAGAKEVSYPLSQIVSTTGGTKFIPTVANAYLWRQFDNAQGTGRREDRIILTGNLIAGVERFKGADGKGQIIFYTTDTGETKSGILMPRNFNLGAALEAEPVIFKDPKHVQEFLDTEPLAIVQTKDGVVSLQYYSYSRFLIKFATARGRGKLYFTHPKLKQYLNDPRDRAEHGFSAYVNKDDLPAVMNIITNDFTQDWRTTSFKDEARKITGQSIPEATPSQRGPAAKPSLEGMIQRQGQSADPVLTPPLARGLAADIRAILKAMNLAGKVSVDVVSQLVHAGSAGSKVAGLYRDGKIWLRQQSREGPIGVLHHELIHLLRDPAYWGNDYGLFTQAEWRTLVARAKSHPDIAPRIRQLYAKFSVAEQTEEMVAELYREWATEGRRESGPLQAAFERLSEFFERLANALLGRGFLSAADVMRRIAEGDIGERGPGPGGGGKPKPSVFRAMLDEDPGAPQPINDTEEQGVINKAITQAMAGKLTLLGLVPGRPLFAELGAKLQSAQTYLRMKEEMDAFRESWHVRTDEIAQRWRKLLSKNGTANKAMMDLMHETTVEGIDPSKPFRRRASRLDYQKVETLPKDSPEFLHAMGKINEDKLRYARYRELRDKFSALPQSFQDMFHEVRDTYSAMADAYEQAVIDNIEKAATINLRRAERAHADELRRIDDEGLIGGERTQALEQADRKLATAKRRLGWGAKARVMNMRAIFESNRIDGPYFPLTRYGEFFATVRDETGKVVSFQRFESVRKRDKFAEEQRAIEGQKVQTGVISEANMRNMVDPDFVAQVEKIIGDAGVSQEVMDAIWQRWLETMPELSVRRHRIHRKGTPGFDNDAFRNFGRHMFHGAHQLARLKYGMEMSDALEEARREAARSREATRLGLIVGEMEKRHDYAMNPKGAAWSQALSSAAFVYYIAMNPAAALNNLTQTTVLGIPIMAANLNPGVGGVAQATGQINRALLDFTRGRGHAMDSARLTPDEKAALDEGYRRGTIDKSQSHDLAGVGEVGVKYSPIRTKVMGRIAFFFHHAERMNREVTFLASYRMAKLNGATHGQAIDKAANLTWKIHFDYQNSSRPRIMQGNTARVILTFRNYQTNMLWRLFRDIYQSFQADTPEARKEARAQLFGISASMMLHAGISGTWGFGLVMLIAGLIFGGSDDEMKEEFKKAVIDTLGERMGGALWYGIPGYMLGIDVSNRIGMPDLWFRSPDRVLEGEDLYNYWVQQTIGAVPGIAENLFVAAMKIRDGDVERGIETAMPTAVKNLMKAYRYAMEGATTTKGDPIVDQVPTVDVIKQALGYTPAEIAERNEVNNRLYAAQTEILDQRDRLLRAAADDWKKGRPIQPGTQAQIDAFNKANPDYPILPGNIMQSARASLRRSARNEFGLTLDPHLNYRLRSEAAPTVFGR